MTPVYISTETHIGHNKVYFDCDLTDEKERLHSAATDCKWDSEIVRHKI